ncbi:hypothetical protein ACNHUS_34715 [Actinomycetes bacterium M1A6_2h]
MSEPVPAAVKVDSLVRLMSADKSKLARQLGCTEAQLTEGKLNNSQLQSLATLAQVPMSYFTDTHSAAFEEVQVLLALIAAGPECVMLRGGADRNQLSSVLSALTEVEASDSQGQ